MKRNITFCLLFLLPLFILADKTSKPVIRYSKQKTIKSVDFLKYDKSLITPKSANEFFTNFLNKEVNDEFKNITTVKLDRGNETFNQYFHGIQVEGAGYAFHYDNEGNMYYAHGNYVRIGNLDTTPQISNEKAMELFAQYKGFDVKQVSDYSSKLIIKVIKKRDTDEKTPFLTYKVFLNINHPKNTEYGYVDAKTGKIICTESFVFHITSTGNFELLYQSTNKTAQTEYTNSGYRLYDNSRSAIIHTHDLANMPFNYFISSSEIYDSDNVWHQSELSGKAGMALDVHWGLQKICDRLYETHGKNSFDNNGSTINAYVRALLYDSQNNEWISNNAAFTNSNGIPQLFFGEGNWEFKPLAALDVVSHEFGHAITAYQIGWNASENYLNEGLSDIWAAIMDYRYGDTNSNVWKVGEQVTKRPQKNCLRDIETPGSSYAITSMADTYGSNLYNSLSPENDYYEMSGVFSHWFYLLVNGGNGYNGKGDYYSLSPIGMDVAEDLIVNAVYNGALRYTESYEDVRSSFAAVARNMNISGLEAAVCNAWYAVGVGEAFLRINGPSLTCNSSTFSVEGLPSGYTAEWSLSDSYYNQHCLQQNYPAANQCTITRSSNQRMINATLTATIKYNGNVIYTLTKTVSAYPDFYGEYTCDNISGTIDYTHTFYVRPGYATFISSPNLENATVSYDPAGTTPLYLYLEPTQWRLSFTTPINNNGVPVILDIDDVLGNHYKLYAMPRGSFYFNIAYGDGYINVTLENDDEKALKTMAIEQPWSYEIRSASMGALKASKSINTRSTTISTIGWPKGVYIIKAKIGKEEVTEKIVVK